MPVMMILAMVMTMLSLLAVGGVVALQVAKSKTKGLGDVLILAACGLLFLGALFLAISAEATIIIGSIFWLIGWPGLAAGFIMNNLAMVKAFGQAMAEKAEQAEKAQQSQQQPEQEQKEQDPQ